MSTYFTINGQQVTCDVRERKADSVRFTLNGKAYHFTGKRLAQGFVLEHSDEAGQLTCMTGNGARVGKAGYQVILGALEAYVKESQTQPQEASAEAQLSPVAPMPGMVRQVLVEKGQQVTSGQPLAVLEAMKLQLTLSAGGEATVADILVTEGQMVDEGAQLVALIPLNMEKSSA